MNTMTAHVVVYGSTNDPRIGGEVTRTFPERGFLWVRGDDGTDYFVHASNIRNGFPIFDMWKGQRCTFVPNVGDGPGEKGPFAEQVEFDEQR